MKNRVACAGSGKETDEVMWDALGLMQQLGVVPALEKAKAAVSNK